MRSKKTSLLIVAGMLATVFAVAVSGSVNSEDPIPDGMVSYWRLDEGSGGVAGDSANGNDGRLEPGGPIWTTGQIDGGLDFEGVNDYVQASSSTNWDMPSGDFTVNLWMYPESKNPLHSGLIGHGGWNCGGGGWDLRLNGPNAGIYDGTIVFYFYHSGGGVLDYIFSSDTISLNQWYLVNVVKSGSTVTLYLNGVDQGSATFATYVPTSNTLEIGAIRHIHNNQYPYYFFDGSIDEVAIWNRALTSTEIEQHYNDGLAGIEITPDENTLGLWHFDDGTGTTATDSSTFNNHGTLEPSSSSRWTTGQVYGALSFDGVDDRIDLPTGVAESTPQDITIEAWIKSTGSTGVFNTIFVRGSDVDNWPWGDWGAILFVWPNNYVTFAVIINQRNYGVSSTFPISTGEWHHVVGVRRGTSLEVWVDGVSNSNSCPPYALRGSGRSYIGYHYWPGYNTHFIGCIDEVAIWNKALTPNEIQYHYINGLMGYDYFYSTPDQAIQLLFDDIQNIEDLPEGSETSLLSKLDAALEALDNDNDNAAIAILNAFINVVAAQSGKKLTVEQANALIAAAQDILDTI